VSAFARVHGAWQGAWCWERLAPELEARKDRQGLGRRAMCATLGPPGFRISEMLNLEPALRDRRSTSEPLQATRCEDRSRDPRSRDDALPCAASSSCLQSIGASAGSRNGPSDHFLGTATASAAITTGSATGSSAA